MKKRLLSLLLALVMLVGIIPATSLTAHAAGTHSILVDGVDMSDGTYLAVGASNTTTSKPSGGYAYWKDDVLTLNNFEIDEGEILCETSFKLYLYGTNTITRTSAESGNKDAISCSEGSLTIDGNGILNIKNDWACIYAYENLIINGGILNLKSTFETVRDKDNRVYFARGTSWYAIEVEGAFSINGGYVYAEAGLSALRAEAYHFNGGACHFNCISEGISGSNGDLENSAICPCDDSYSIGNPLTLVKESCRSFEDVSFDKICDYMAYSNFPKYTELVIISEIEFANQFPEMPAGKTEHNLGKVSSEYAMTFGAIDTFLPLVNKGYKIIEKLIVYDRDNNKIVDTVTNNPQLSGTGISYSLKNLPSGNYIIRESIILYDKDGKALYSNNNDFILEVERTVNNINVSATFSGTPADATTSTTGAAVTATKWYKKNGSGWTELGASDTIKEGNTYRCEVTVGTTGDYVFTDGYTVKINGIAATKKSGNTWYRDVTITGYTR